MSTSTITRRAAITGTAAGAAAIAAGSVPAMANVDHHRERAIQALIDDIRVLSTSTPCGMYSVLQAVADRLERALGGDTTDALVEHRDLFDDMAAHDAKLATTIVIPFDPPWPGLHRIMAGDLLRGAS